MSKKRGLQVLDVLRERNNSRLLATPQARRSQHSAHMGSLKDVEAESLSDIAIDAGDAAFGKGYIRLDGVLTVLRLNRINILDNDATPSIEIPAVYIEDNNHVDIELRGWLFQNSGSDKTVTPRLVLRKDVLSGSGVTSESAVTLATDTRRAYIYRLRISAGPSDGEYVLCHEEFILEQTTTKNIYGFIRDTTTNASVLSYPLSEINNFYIEFDNSATATMFRIGSDILTVRLVDGDDSSVRRWLSTPDTLGNNINSIHISDAQPTTNFASSATFDIGESSSSATIRRTLFKFDDMLNIPANAQVQAVYLHITLSLDLATNGGTFEVYRVLRNWNPASVTWNEWDSGQSWGTAGCGNSSTDYDGAVLLGSLSYTATETIGTVKTISLDPTEFMKWLDGTYPNYGFMVKSQTELNNAYRFHASIATLQELAPLLEVVYTLPN